MSSIIIDAGPLVAYLTPNDSHHAWAVREFGRLPPPFASCEAVLSEAIFLLQRTRDGVDLLLQMLDTGVLKIRFEVFSAREHLHRLLSKYADFPMSLADACLVRMSEQMDDAVVFTIDKHFHLYRRNGRQMIPLIFPNGRAR